MSTTNMSGKPGWITLARDISMYVGGWVLIGYQALFVPPASVNEWFLLLGGSMIGVPGIGEILSLKAKQAAGTGTGTSPTSPPAPDSSAQR